MKKIIVNKKIKIFSLVSFIIVIAVFFIAKDFLLAEETPADPSGLTYTNTTTGLTVMLNWQDNSNNEDSFVIERKSSLENTFMPVGTTGAGASSYSDTTPSSGGLYNYRVKACLASNCSGYSNIIYVQVQWGNGGGGATVPTAPTGFAASTNMPPVSLSWNVSSGGATHFNLGKKLSTNTSYTSLITITYPTTNYIDTNVVPGLSYDYQIQSCITGAGCSSFVNLSNVVVPGGQTVPSTPSDLSLISTTIPPVKLSWIGETSNNIYYTIDRKLNSSSTSDFIQIGQASTTLYTDFSTVLSPGSSYDYRVKACSSSTNCSSPSGTLTVLIPEISIIPNSPSSLLVNGTITYSSVPLVWTDNSSDENSFKIERKVSGSTNSFSYIGQTGTNISSYSDNNISPGLSYDYRVQACSSVGCSSYVELLSVAVPVVGGGSGGNNTSIPNPPSNLTVVTTLSMPPVQLNWTNNSSNQDKYNIERKLHSSLSWTTVTQLQGSNITSYTDNSSSLIPGLSYDYRVQACLSNVGCSAWAVLYEFIIPYINTNQNTNTSTIPLAPTNFIINGATAYSSVPLKWTDNSNNEDSFVIYRKLSSALVYPTMPLTTTAPNTISFTDVTAPQNLFWDYKIQACNGTMCSPFAFLYNVTSTGTFVIPPSQNLNITTSSSSFPYVPISTNTAINNLTTSTTNQVNYQNVQTNTVTKTSQNIVKNTTTTLNSNNNVNTLNTTTLPKADIKEVTSTTLQTKVSTQIQNIGQVVEEINTTINNTKEELIKLVDESVTDITEKVVTVGGDPDINKINSLKEQIQDSIDKNLSTSTISSLKVEVLKKEIGKSLEEIRSVATEGTNLSKVENEPIKEITTVLGGLSETISNQNATLSLHGGDLLYKDTNKDGISDYDSVNIYNIDPVKPSPVSVYEGKTIKASEKILLGFDPTKSDLVKIEPEQPILSVAPVVSVYKVENVSLVENKKDIVIKGKALPNSFVTVYIYSTPIMVTVKTDNTGEWKYVLDKELENGDHTIYTATVNNSGNIVAKSSPYLFTKTAEAVTLKDITSTQIAPENKKPGLLNGKSLYIAITVIIAIIVASLLFIGMSEKRKKIDQIDQIDKIQ